MKKPFEAPALLITPEFLASIRKRSSGLDGILPSYATHEAESLEGISQINRIWASLPEAMRESADLKARLLNFRDESQFWSGFSEAFMAWMLANSKGAFEYCPLVGGLTPDFRLPVSNQEYLLDVKASEGNPLLSAYHQRRRLLRNELRKVEAKFWLHATACWPNEQSNFNGIAAKLQQIVPTIEQEDEAEKIWRIEAGGAGLEFTVFPQDEVRSVYGGGPPLHWSGYPEKDSLTKAIDEKAGKYRSPLIVTYFCTQPQVDPFELLTETLVGQTGWIVTAYGDPDSQRRDAAPRNMLNGLWGRHGRAVGTHRHLHGVVVIVVDYNDSAMKFRIMKAIRSEQREIMRSFLPDVPDLFDDTAASELQPLEVRP